MDKNIGLTDGVSKMSLRDTIHHMNQLLIHISESLAKASGGNKAAAQRVRTGTIIFEKVAKLFRKESVRDDKITQLKKKSKIMHPKTGGSRRKAQAKKPSRKK